MKQLILEVIGVIPHELQTIEEWYLEKYNEKPARYGSSFIKTIYDLNRDLPAEQMQIDLNEIIEVYEKQTFFINNS